MASITKQERFLWMVQTVYLSNAINRSLDDEALERRHEFSATGTIGFTSDALEASERIPDHMSAAEAADEFLGWMIEHLREPDDTVPGWFAKG